MGSLDPTAGYVAGIYAEAIANLEQQDEEERGSQETRIPQVRGLRS